MIAPFDRSADIVCAPCNYFSSFTSPEFTGAINSGEFQYIEHKLLNNLYAIFVPGASEKFREHLQDSMTARGWGKKFNSFPSYFLSKIYYSAWLTYCR